MLQPQSILPPLIQGILNLIINSRLSPHTNPPHSLLQLLPDLPLHLPSFFSPILSSSLSQWFFDLLSISSNYIQISYFLQRIFDFRVTFKVTDKIEEKILYCQNWNIRVDRLKGQAERRKGRERVRQEVVELVEGVLRVIKQLPLTDLLVSNRNLLKQCSIYYIISRVNNKRAEEEYFQYQSRVVDHLITFNVEVPKSHQLGEKEGLLNKLHVKQEKVRKRSNQYEEHFKRKESYSTMGSEGDNILSQKQIDNQFEIGNTGVYQILFEEDEEESNKSNQSFISIRISDNDREDNGERQEGFIEEDEQPEVIESQEVVNVRNFIQALGLLRINEQIPK